MPLPSVFQGVQDCRLPALKPPKCSRRPPRQQLLQLHAPAICFSRGSRLPFARPQSPQTLPTLPQASKATTLTANMSLPSVFQGVQDSRLQFARPQTPQTLPTGLQGKNSYSYMPLPSVFQGVQDCRLPALKPPKRFRRPPRQQLLQLHAPAICLQGVQDCRLPALKPPKRFRRPPRQQLLQLHAPAICFSGGSRLPFARPQTFQTLPQASKATTLTATCPCHLFFRRFKTAVCPPSNPPNAPAGLQGNNCYSYMPLPSVFQGVQDCRLPALKPPKRFRRPPRQQLLQLHAPAICFSRGFKTAVCPPSNPPNASAGLQGNNSYSYMPLPSVFQGVPDCRLTALKPPKRFQPSRRPPRQQLLQLHVPAICFSGVQDCRLPGLQPPKRCQPSRRPPRQQLLQLHAPAICFSGSAWATRACDSPSLMGLLLWHEPFCFLAWFPSRRVMVDVNLPRRTA